MKTWQIFVIGTVGLFITLLLTSYERILCGLAAILMVASVVAGFLVRPRKDMYRVRTTVLRRGLDGFLTVEHGQIAVRVELARLWLLFVPTFAAIAFLVVSSAKGLTWNISILDGLFNAFAIPIMAVINMFELGVVGLLSMWVSERWVLHDAEACSAESLAPRALHLRYCFKNAVGEYYGGETFQYTVVPAPELKTIVFYRPSKPESNKLAIGCLFHRVVVLGRGIPEFDAITMATNPITAAKPLS
jgi:hypothetical protein